MTFHTFLRREPQPRIHLQAQKTPVWSGRFLGQPDSESGKEKLKEQVYFATLNRIRIKLEMPVRDARGDSDVCFFFCSTWFVCFQLWFGSRFGRLNVRLVDCLSWLAGRSLLACMCINWTSCDAWHRLLFCLHSSSMEEGALFSSLSLHARSGGACHILLRKGTILSFFLETLKEWTMSGKSVCARGKLRMIRCYYMHGLPQSTDN
jgi:hypothetical protein